jgi:hypothetical protein
LTSGAVACAPRDFLARNPHPLLALIVAQSNALHSFVHHCGAYIQHAFTSHL